MMYLWQTAADIRVGSEASALQAVPSSNFVNMEDMGLPYTLC
jgi:hypothetical protein